MKDQNVFIYIGELAKANIVILLTEIIAKDKLILIVFQTIFVQ